MRNQRTPVRGEEEEEEEEEKERADRIGSPSRLHARELKDIRVRGNPSLRQGIMLQVRGDQAARRRRRRRQKGHLSWLRKIMQSAISE